MPTLKRSRIVARRGAATVEFAIVAPLLVLMVLGTVEVTRIAQVKTVLSDAVRNGCRIGIQPRMEKADVTAAVESVLLRNGISKANASIDIQVKNGEKAAWKSTDMAAAPRGAWIKLSVTIPLKDVAWVTPIIFSSSAKQTESLAMMRQ